MKKKSKILLVKNRIKKRFQRIRKNQISYFKLFISLFSIILSTFFILKKKNNSTNTLGINSVNVPKNESNNYFCCFCVMGKMENRYTRELISYYMSIGVDKFVIADNNLPNTEKFTDVIQDYINNGIVDYIDIRGQAFDYSQYYDIMYQNNKNRCEWIMFFDFDEYLVMHSEDGRNLTLKEYLSNNKFNKCEAIAFNWLMYSDNDLVYYDNRTSLERFTKPDYNHGANRFVKSMIRGHLNKTVFITNHSCHKPVKNITTCDSNGNIPNYSPDSIVPPLLKYAYLIHFNPRTAEEFVIKVKRGYAGNRYPNYNEKVNSFFKHNKFTEEKLKVFEKNFNQTFYQYHSKKA